MNFIMKLVKDVIKAAEYRPNPHNRDFVVPVTTDTIDHWVDTFGKMRQADIKIPAPWEHPPVTDPHTNPIEWSKRRDGDPRNNAGWVDSMYRDGDTMYAVFDVPDDVGESLKKTGCYVSPKFGGTWRDSLDRVWENPVHHIALTTKPVAVNQSSEFKPAEALAFSRAMCFSTTEWANAQEWSQPETDEMADDDLTPEEAMKRILENPDAQVMARQILGMQEFSAPAAASAQPPGLPAAQPDPYAAPESAADDDQDGCDDGDPMKKAMAILFKTISVINDASKQCMAAVASLHGVDLDQDDDGEDDDSADAEIPSPAPQGAPQVTATPAVVSMSREENEFSREEFEDMRLLNAAMANKLTRTEQDALNARVNALFESGRCTKPEMDALAGRIGKYEFSRQADMDNVLLIKEIEILERLKEGAATGASDKTEFSRNVTVSTPNQAFNDGDDISDERADEILAKAYGLKRN